MARREPIYTGESFWWRIPNVQIDGALVTDLANTPDSFTWALVKRDGTSIDTGVMAHSATVDGTWEAEIVLPATSGAVIVQAIATKGATSVGFWRDFIEVRSRL